MGEQYHVSVMPNECIETLDVKSGGIYFDATLGGGGHSELILRKGGSVVAVDRDSDAIDYVTRKFAKIPEFEGRYKIVHDNFKNVKQVLRDCGINELDGAIADLGISSRQVDDAERGFSYSKDGELDMRMDREQELSALSVVNEYSEEQLSRIIFTYGEERFARKIAADIVRERKLSPIETTGRLSELIQRSVPPRKNGHPAKKTLCIDFPFVVRHNRQTDFRFACNGLNLRQIVALLRVRTQSDRQTNRESFKTYREGNRAQFPK